MYGTKVTYLKKPDYFKMKTFEDESLGDKSQELSLVFGTKKATRISKSKTNNAIDVPTDVFNNISFSCMYKILYKCKFRISKCHIFIYS